MKLYEIISVIDELNAKLEDGEIDLDTYKDTLESVELDREDKVEGIVRSIRNDEALITDCAAEIKRLQERKLQAERRNESRKAYLKEQMDRAGDKKWKAGTFTVSIQKNGGKLPLIVGVDARDLPIILQRWDPVANTDEIRARLERGEEIPGCYLGERGESLRIK